MRKISSRTKLLVSLGIVCIPLGVMAVTAYACTMVATLAESSTSAAPGATITIRGQNFGTHNPSDATSNGPVQIRLGTVDGPVLATANPAGGGSYQGTFSVQVTIPANAVPGQTFITATQNTSAGVPVFGSPARQAFTVTAPASATSPLFGPVTFKAPCVVPAVQGVRASTAMTMIRNANCTVGHVTTAKKPHSKSHHRYTLVIASADQSAGTTLAHGSKVDLRLRWK